MKAVLFSIILALFTSFAHASEPCEDVRLDGPGGSMEHVPVLDQGELPLCTMASAAQALDAWRFSHGDKNHQTRTSFSHLALKCVDEVSKDFYYDGVRDNDLLKDIQPEGVCGITTSVPESTLFADARYYYLKYHATHSTCGLEKSSLAQLKGFSYSATRKIINSDSGNALSEFSKALCPEKSMIKISPLEFKIYSVKNYDETRKSLRSILKGSPAQPAFLSYCANILSKDSSFVGVTESPGREKNWSREGSVTREDVDPKCGGHRSLLIGRKKVGNQCFYLIRNTWGTSCDHYKWDCEGGNVWVDEDTLVQNTKAIKEIGLKP